MVFGNLKREMKMDQGLEQQFVNRDRGSTAGTSTRMRAIKVYGLAAIEFWFATDAVVAAIRLAARGMSNWFIFPLVLVAFLLTASATYAIAYHKLRSAFHLTEGRSPTPDMAGSQK